MNTSKDNIEHKQMDTDGMGMLINDEMVEALHGTSRACVAIYRFFRGK